MAFRYLIFFYMFFGNFGWVQAQYSYKKASDFGLDNNVKKVIEVTYRFNFDIRKCQEVKRTTMEFTDDGKLLSEAIQKNGSPIETITYNYDDNGRLVTIQSDERIEFTYQHNGDTLIVDEVSNNRVKRYEFIYKQNKLEELFMFKNDVLLCHEKYRYSNDNMRGKSVQFFNRSGNKETYEVHRYRNGRTIFFRKKNSDTDNKTCHYYYNSIDNSLDFEETARPGMDAVISKDCNYQFSKGYWISKSEEFFSVPKSSMKLSAKQNHFFHFRKIFLKDGMKIGSIRIQKVFVNDYIE